MAHVNLEGFFEGLGRALLVIWQSATTHTAAPSAPIVLAMGALALCVVLVTPVWRVARNVITIAHEGAHAVVALVCGRRLDAIRLHSDTSGLTVTAGRPRGFGMVATMFAGYVGPAVLGLGAAWLTRIGYPTGLAWLLVVLLVFVLVKIRNWFGFVAVIVVGGVLGLVSWYGQAGLRSAVAYALVWFLLLGSVRPIFELQHQRRAARGRSQLSDADQLASLTRLPGMFWVIVFFLVTAGCLTLGAWWLVEPVWHATAQQALASHLTTSA
jgi:hypothetical protein